MTNDFNPTEWITTAEAAELTGYDLTHIRRLAREGRVQGRKFGRDWMINHSGLLPYANKMRDLGPSKHDPWQAGARQRRDKVS